MLDGLFARCNMESERGGEREFAKDFSVSTSGNIAGCAWGKVFTLILPIANGRQPDSNSSGLRTRPSLPAANALL